MDFSDINGPIKMSRDDSVSTTMDIVNESDVVEHGQLPSVNPYYDGRDELLKRSKNGYYRKLLYCLAASILVTITLIGVMVGIVVRHPSTGSRPKPVESTTVAGTTGNTTAAKASHVDVACHFLGYTEIKECLSATEYDGDAVTNTLLTTIPTEIGALQQLQKLSFNRDIHMTGTLPTEIGMLTQLTSLLVSGVGLTGVIPDTIGQLTLLQTLRLDHNAFDGPIPTTMGSLSRLHELDVSHNELTGAIPSAALGNWTQVTSLWLQSNRFVGSIPSTIGQMTDCEILILADNVLTGSIPSSIGNMTSLQVLMLFNNNQLTGGIPIEFSSLEALSRVWFTNNTNMHGTIPTSIQKLNIGEIDFANTKLYGTIPNSFCRRFMNATHYVIDCEYSSTPTTEPKIYCNCCVDPTERICPNSTFIV